MPQAGALGAVDIQVYAKAIERIAGILALGSLVPVIFSGRFGSHVARSEQLARKRTVEAQGAEATDKKQAGEECGGKKSTIGIPCVILLVAGEVFRCWDIFRSPAPTKGKSDKFSALLAGIKKGRQEIRPSAGALDAALAAVNAALDAEGAFEAARGIVTLAALGVVVASMFLQGAQAAMGLAVAEGPPGKKAGRSFSLCVGIAWPVAVFAWMQQAPLLKAWRALATEQFLASLYLPCRVAAALAAARPSTPGSEGGGGGGGAPPLFAALQAASLLAGLSAELARGGVAGLVAAWRQSDSKVSLLLDPALHTVITPSLIGLLWLLLVHLQWHLGALVLSSLLSIASSPVVLATGWPTAAQALGIIKTPGSEVAALMHILSAVFAATAASVFVAGGTQSILVGMGVAQVIVRIHGADGLMETFS